MVTGKTEQTQAGPHHVRAAWSRLALATLIALAYASEVLFQPDVSTWFDTGQIAVAVATLFAEGFCIAGAILIAVALVERRREPKAWRYTLMLALGVLAGSAIGVLLGAAFSYRGNLADAAPYLAGQTLRFTLLGVVLALVDGFKRRLQVATARELELQMARAALEAQTDLSQLRLLEAQIEPHFLFNTIANLRRTWRIDAALGERMHDNVMRYLAASLPQMRASSGTLGAEVELTRAYLELFALRMGPRLRFTIDLSPSLDGLCFPRMTLITLAENAIKHGLMPSDQGGTIAIRARAEGASLVVSVSDDGVGFGAADTAGTGIGLANIRARLLTQHGRAARLSLKAGEGGGVEATIRLPFAPDPVNAPNPRQASPASAASVAHVGLPA
ncbi:MAG: histidine kinase [Burkholderiales bacterium]|nr:histidine kinase [Burkholderiales bacterium]